MEVSGSGEVCPAKICDSRKETASTPVFRGGCELLPEPTMRPFRRSSRSPGWSGTESWAPRMPTSRGEESADQPTTNTSSAALAGKNPALRIHTPSAVVTLPWKGVQQWGMPFSREDVGDMAGALLEERSDESRPSRICLQKVPIDRHDRASSAQPSPTIEERADPETACSRDLPAEDHGDRRCRAA